MKLPETNTFFFSCLWRFGPYLGHSLVSRCFEITARQTSLCRTSPDERSVRRRDLYQTTHNTHNRQKWMYLVGIETSFPSK